MEEKINIAEILKDKPVNTKLYSPLFSEVFFSHVSGGYIAVEHHGGTSLFLSSGKFYDYDGAEPLLFPSKEMQDWSKFAWKKGDILVNKDAEVHIIFDGFKDDTYKTFHGQYYLWEEEGSIVNFEENEDYMQTSEFYKANKEETQTYINTIEERLGGKLNRETLEIEKNQPEFKNGDIAFADYGNRQNVFIVSNKTGLSEGYNSFISLDLSSSTLSMGYRTSFFKKDLCRLRLATKEEKQQLFDALEKEGKAWDAEKKVILDLKPKVELKPFDKVLVRDSQSDKWRVNLFGYIDKDEYYHCAFANWVYCIPYAGNEHLLGTTKDVEG
jgi:hypothetical protein